MFGFRLPFVGGDDKAEDNANKEQEGAATEEAVDTRSPEEKLADEMRLEEKKKMQAKAYNDRRTPEPGRRKFSLIIQNIVVKNTDEKNSHDIFLKFVLGRTKKTQIVNGKKVTAGKPGQKMRTEVWKKLKADTSVNSTRIFKKLWHGEYTDLEKQDLAIQVWDWDRWTPNDFVCEVKIRLVDLAQSSVLQSFAFRVTDNGVETTYCTLQVEIYFFEIFNYELEFVDWRGNALKAADATIFGGPGSSDPFIKFWIPKVVTPIKRGYSSGRSTKTAVIRNTLYPVFGDALSPLYYTGTRAGLENEMLHIDVYDWDVSSNNDLIGQAYIPMAGILNVGFIKVFLALEEPSATNKKKKVWNDYGYVQGYIKAKHTPLYTQIGQPVVLKKGLTYLAVKIEKAENLKAADVNGKSDPFFVVEWDGSQAQTPVQEKTLHPVFKYTMYFAVKAIKVSQNILEKKDAIKLVCYDWDESGSNDILGKCEISLDKITSALPAAKDVEETRGRMYSDTIPLILPGIKSEATVTVKAWFEPELPVEIKLNPPSVSKTKDIPKIFKDRHKEWKAAFPRRADPTRTLQFNISAIDEENISHFYCEYVGPIQLPPEENFPVHPITPNVVARLVRNITFVPDKDCVTVPGPCWISPNFFMDMRKGDIDAHAILLCNLFLGMGLDAYICVGKSKFSASEHVWVMTREADGSVIFWESSTGQCATLPNRWQGEEVIEEPGAETETAAEEGNQFEDPKDKKKKRKKLLSDEELAALRQKEQEMMFLDDDVVFSSKTIADDAIGDPELRLAPPTDSDEESSSASEGEAELVHTKELPPVSINYSCLEVVFNATNVWGNVQVPQPQKITYDFEDLSTWSPFIGGWKPTEEIKPFYDVRATLPPGLTLSRCELLEKDIVSEIEGSLETERHELSLATEFFPALSPILREGIMRLEQAVAVGSEVARREFDAWKGRLVSACPPGHRFEGRPVSFTYTDAKKIRRYLFDKLDYHKAGAQGLKFSVACRVIPYPMSVVVIWVYYAKLYPNDQKE